MTNKDCKCYRHGSYKVTCNQKYFIASYGWLGGNPVHLMTTADGTGTTTVLCQTSREKVMSIYQHTSK
eukprot:1761736-Ditylum_brightwellii.AAC.1